MYRPWSCYKKAYYSIRDSVEDTDDEGAEYIVVGVGSIVGLMVFFIGTNLTWLQIWVAPKFYLIEYAKSFM